MACKASFEFHHNFPKLAEEAGFTFNSHRPKVHIDWNKIRLLDVDSLMRERKFVLIENHLYDILDCVLDSEFDVRILDEGVVKMFRLAQLTVEYQQFCRHYLDRSVCVLRDELTAVMQELEDAKKNLKQKDEEVKKIRKRIKSNPKSIPFLYGNENLADAILKTLTANRSNIFPSTAAPDTSLQYNKCKYCDKVFMNQLYLKSHVHRRHAGMQDVPVKDTTDKLADDNDNEVNTQLQAEVKDLQQKIRDLEENITQQIASSQSNKTLHKVDHLSEDPKVVQSKDAEVSVNNDSNLIEKLEEWKTKEQTKHNVELNDFCKQIVECINTLKEQNTNSGNENTKNVVDMLSKTINEQEKQILELKEELRSAKSYKENLQSDAMTMELHKCTKQIDAQTKQCQILLENLNKMTTQAQEARSLAEAESRRAASLQAQLETHLLRIEKNNRDDSKPHVQHIPVESGIAAIKTQERNQIVNKKSLEVLHQRAQELLNIVSSSSSDSCQDEKVFQYSKKQAEKSQTLQPYEAKKVIKKCTPVKKAKASKKLNENSASIQNFSTNTKYITSEKSKPESLTAAKENIIPKSSPKRIIRAKITEEVNKHLIETGIDPLSSSIKQSIFEKISNKFSKEQKIKSKNILAYERIRHSLLTYLDSKVINHEETVKRPKPLPRKDLPKKTEAPQSMLSNMKTKALKFVKDHQKYAADLHSDDANIQHFVPKSNIDVRPQIHRQKADLNYKHNSLVKQSKNIDVESTSLEESSQSSDNNENVINTDPPKHSVENLIKSPARRPHTANGVYQENRIVTTSNKANSSTILSKVIDKNISNESLSKLASTSFSDNIMVTTDEISYKASSNINMQVGPKGVLKNAPSTSSLNKKKVLFDMDAIQMKSLSASPSQSITEKSENFELGLVNLDDEEWDISSIENGLHENDKKIEAKVSKVMELRDAIENQLEKRSKALSTVPVGGVDILKSYIAREAAAGLGGSNTSLGSSVFDESDEKPIPTRQSFIKTNEINNSDHDESELDISDHKKNSF